MNRTIMEKAQSMLSNSGLEKNFWAEAVRTACYLINISPTTALDGGIPEEVRTGKNLNYSHLKIFGCEAFIHIPKENRTKLDDKSMKCIFWDMRMNILVIAYGIQSNIKLLEEKGILQEPLQEIQPDNAPPHMVHRSSKPHKPSQRYPPSNYILLTDEGEPNCLQEACKVEHNKEWKKAMEEEMNSLQENKTWELVNLPKGRKALQNKSVYRIKHEGDEKKERYKARLVVKGFSQ
eukprot:PITA_22567